MNVALWGMLEGPQKGKQAQGSPKVYTSVKI